MQNNLTSTKVFKTSQQEEHMATCVVCEHDPEAPCTGLSCHGYYAGCSCSACAEQERENRVRNRRGLVVWCCTECSQPAEPGGCEACGSTEIEGLRYGQLPQQREEN